LQPQHIAARPSGAAAWPLWVLWASLPLALALGFIGGMAAATYLTPPPAPAATTSAQTQVPAMGATSGPAPSAQPENPPVWSDVGQARITARPLPITQAVAKASLPTNVYDQSRMRDIRDARAELVRAFSRYQAGLSFISRIDYQQMRNAGVGTSLVGMLSVDDYAGWARTLHSDPNGLRSWLESATRRVLAAMERDHFAVSWAVVDVRSERPAGFADFEVTPLTNGTFLVIRPLAATVDPSEPTVSLRPAPTPGQPIAALPAISTPWATYGPVLRFDTTDLYRPLGTAGTKPK